MARKTDSSTLPHSAPTRSAPDAAGRARLDKELAEPLEVGPPPPSHLSYDDEPAIVDAENSQAVGLDDCRIWWQQRFAQEAAESRSGRWRLTPLGRALVAVFVITGSVLALRAGAPSSDLFAYDGPADTQFPGDKTVAEPSHPGGPSGKDSVQSMQGTVAKERTVDPSTQASPLPVLASESGDVGAIQPAARNPNTTPVAPKVDTSPVATLSSPPAQSHELQPTRRVSSAPEATRGAAGSPKRPGKLTARVVVATTESSAYSGTANAGSKPVTPTGPEPAKPEKEASAPKSAQAMTEPAAGQASPEAAKAPPNPLVRAIGALFAARPSPAQQPVDSTPTTSTGWAAQLATTKSEVEAKSALKRLNAKYASALNGSTIRLHKARVDGDTVYRLRVARLSKAGAAALCERLKGDGGNCSIVR
ncbi:MAG TPA: SPOR domain-containing protein [Roseiarcus sp.]|nr:SPOR domain-containing protein [Roseiarcus sp.]